MVRAFALVMGSILSHRWARERASKAQKLAVHFRASSKSRALFEDLKDKMKVPGGLPSKASRTSLASVGDCVQSVERHAAVFTALARDKRLDEDVKAVTREPTLFLELRFLAKMLAPIARVVTAVQSAHATLADATRCWLYLARAIEEVVSDPAAQMLLPPGAPAALRRGPCLAGPRCLGLHASVKPREQHLVVHALLTEFLRHVCAKFELRSREMDGPLCRLALFLDVRYKDAVPAEPADFREMCRLVGGQRRLSPPSPACLGHARRLILHF
jgi:hypothetical protein